MDAFLAQFFLIVVAGRFHPSLQPVYFAVQSVIFVGELAEMRVRRFQGVDFLEFIRKLFGEFVRRMGHFSPFSSAVTGEF